MSRLYLLALVFLLASSLSGCGGGGDSAAGGDTTDDDVGPPLDDDDNDTTGQDDDLDDDDDDDTADDDATDDDATDDDVTDDDVTDDDATDDDVTDDDVTDDDVVDDDVVDDDATDDDTTIDPPTVEILEPADGQTYFTNEQSVLIAITSADTVTVQLDGHDVTDQLTITATTVSGTVDGVTAGAHTLAASVENAGGWDSDQVGFNTEIGDPYLDLTLTRYSAQVGTEVTRTVHVYDEMGNDITSQVTIAYELTPATGYTQTGPDSFIFSVLDTWTFTASCEYNKQTLSDTEEHASYDHVPHHIALALDRDTAQAGTIVIANTMVFNSFNQELEDYPVQLDVEPGNGVTINGALLTFTIATNYTVTAYPAGYPAITASDTITITPGAPLGIELTLSDHAVDAGQFVDYDVEMMDQWGNVWTSGWTIKSVPTTGVVIDTGQKIITFNKAGNFTITAKFYTIHDDEVVTVTDNTPPALEWSSPQRGLFTASPMITLEGYVTDIGGDVTSLVINGYDVTFNPDTGQFYYPVSLVEGYNIFEATVTDTSDNSAKYAISVLRGGYLANDAWVDNAVGARVNESGLDTVEEIAETWLNEEFDLVGMIMAFNPLVDDTIDLGFMVCDVYAETTGVSLDPIQIILDAKPDYILTGLEVTDFLLEAEFDIACVDDSGKTLYQGVVAADSFSAGLPIYISVVDHELQLSFGELTLDTVNFGVYIDGIDPELIAVLTAIILPLVEDMINQIIQEELPPIIEEILSNLELSFSFDLFGHLLTLEAAFDDLDIIESGLILWMGARTTADSYDPNVPTLPGSFYKAGARPTLNSLSPGGQPYELGAAIGLNAINQLLYIMFRAGVLNLVLDENSGFGIDLTAGDLELFFPGISAIYGPEAPVVISTQAYLPPIVDFSPTDSADISLQLGEFFIDMAVHEPTTDESVSVLSMAVALQAPVSVEASPAGNAFNFVIGEPVISLDVMDSMSNLPDQFFESFVPLLVDFILPFISNFLNEFPIPVFEGYTLSIAELTIMGQLEDYLGVFGSLVEAPPLLESDPLPALMLQR